VLLLLSPESSAVTQLLLLAAGTTCSNLANGVTQPDLLLQQDLATVAPSPSNQRHESTVKINAPTFTVQLRPLSETSNNVMKYCNSMDTAAEKM